jgi:putative two-component system response regulator
MSASKRQNEDFGTLEELDVTEAEEFQSETSEGTEQRLPKAALAENLRDLVSSYAIVPIPVAILDESLAFMYKNASFERTMVTFEGAGKPTLFGAIGRFLDADTARSLIANIRSPEKGFSWTGTIRLRSSKTSSVISKTTIVPFRPEASGNERPHAWVAFMDDVTEEQNGFLHGLFLSLLEASKLKDNDTGRHIERVNLYAERLAKVLHGRAGWPEIDIDFIENIGFLAAMHDVGKIGTPDDILNKKGPLDEFEWNIMKEHTINGAFILSSYPDPMAKQIAQSHHEWWDGTGYPYKLMGDMIPLPARIVSIADVYDALRMRRSYKEPFDHKRASLLIVADAGTHFDPALVEVFKTIDADFDQIYEVNADVS